MTATPPPGLGEPVAVVETVGLAVVVAEVTGRHSLAAGAPLYDLPAVLAAVTQADADAEKRGRDEERAAVVAYFQRWARVSQGIADKAPSEEGRREFGLIAEGDRKSADAIERGEHRPDAT